MVKTLNQFTGKRKSASIGIQNDVFKSETKEISKKFTSKDSQHLNSLTQYLSEVKRIKMEEEYKVCRKSVYQKIYLQVELTWFNKWISSLNTFIQAIQKGELHSCIEGKKQENKSKNRYTTIFPCKFDWWFTDKHSFLISHMISINQIVERRYMFIVK